MSEIPAENKEVGIHTTATDAHVPRETPKGSYLALLSLAALGVVFGDIGTSPLYALRECFHGPHALPGGPTPENVLGVLSLIVWSLLIIVSIKYVIFILRADNKGEGGILSLTALLNDFKPSGKKERRVIVFLGVVGAALIYGDGIITPSISVLSALEGVKIANPNVSTNFIVYGTVAIIVLLFLVQRTGTGVIGALFGPITLVWFLVIGALGISEFAHNPMVLKAVNPYWALEFFHENGLFSFFIMGSVFLVVTGGEALYADMGHFGVRPIRLAWFGLVLPSLLANYFGQGALILSEPEAVSNPFYNLAPQWALVPLVALATMATIIASQALISGVFSLTSQAISLGLLPRMQVKHTSHKEFGQIYLPLANWLLMAGCIVTVVLFRSSSALAAAYGTAVTSAMVITTALFYRVARDNWKWSRLATVSICGFFLIIELIFFGANIIKFADGGWFPLAIAAVLALVIFTWKKGRRALTERIQAETDELDEPYLNEVHRARYPQTPGMAVYMNGNAKKVPQAFELNLKHNKILHERNLFVTVKMQSVPYVNVADRSEYEHICFGFHRVRIYYGYMDDIDVPRELDALKSAGFRLGDDVTYFLGRETVVPTRKYHTMALWREKLFAFFSRNAQTATQYFNLPPEKVVELGAQIEI